METNKDKGRSWILMCFERVFGITKISMSSSYCFNLTKCKNNHDHNHDFKVLEDDIPSVVVSMGLTIMSIASFIL